MAINYWAVLVCAIASMIVGSVWYGPIFGKKWMQICGADKLDMEARKKMQKAAGPLYLAQFLLTLLQLWVFANILNYWPGASTVWIAVFMWVGFIMPTIAGSSMWNNDASKVKWARFLIQSGYQLVMFIIFGLILGLWK
ncbi:MAG: DUF1761 domain-containing protein [Candidatus Gracilibacteria bacterium]